MNIYSSGEYRQNNPTWHDEDAPWKAREILKILRKNSLNPKSILDIGCGTGSILKIIKMKLLANKAIGYEPYDEVIIFAKSKNPDIRFTSMLPEEKFDLTLLIDVIEHIESPNKLLQYAKNIAEYKIFHIPLALSWQARLRKSPLEHSLKYTGHLHTFTKKSSLEYLRQNNYKIIDFTYTRGALLSPRKSYRQKILNIFRLILFPLFPNLTSNLLGGFSLIVLAK